MNLIYHGNCQLQPVSTAEGGVRNPAVFGAIVTYIRDILNVFGIDLLPSKVRTIMYTSCRGGGASLFQKRSPSIRTLPSGLSE
ncbi:hypothetical protein XENOCAPTIV_013443 [Xenoophorus captivus]|uniref:Uncharacterized protein n=1 Tax=Xenoophorus captivus TaxID=1517983 RepID=A0ABV0R8I5_9TELE